MTLFQGRLNMRKKIYCSSWGHHIRTCPKGNLSLALWSLDRTEPETRSLESVSLSFQTRSYRTTLGSEMLSSGSVSLSFQTRSYRTTLGSEMLSSGSVSLSSVEAKCWLFA
ncbi:hypothetical protein BWD14_10145 [Leptospira santarosai]|uniref:Uncharacterized protein n=1 Tax=Leptospira santarosai TaxID=28183 RepID=A0AB73M4A2_9LEPT|nr:hypothetical protein BWD14_10145 [Leptospira santarosai]